VRGAVIGRRRLVDVDDGLRIVVREYRMGEQFPSGIRRIESPGASSIDSPKIRLTAYSVKNPPGATLIRLVAGDRREVEFDARHPLSIRKSGKCCPGVFSGG
jgi:hypothetical protein